MALWHSRLTIVDGPTGQPVQHANVRSPVGTAVTNQAGQVGFFYIDDVEWYVAGVMRQSYKYKEHRVTKADPNPTIRLDRATVPNTAAPFGLWVQDWDRSRCILRWQNPRSYNKVLVGWSHPPGSAHRQLPDLSGSPTRATIQGNFAPGEVFDLKVKGLESSAYSPWAVLRWTVPPEHAAEFIEIQGSSLPARSMVVGREADGTALYLGRAFHAGSMIPGKYRNGWSSIAAPYGGGEMWLGSAAVYARVLTGSDETGIWLPPGEAAQAVPAGWESDRTPLYAARAPHAGGIHIGKWRRDWSAAAIPYGGRELWLGNFEVLCGAA